MVDCEMHEHGDDEFLGRKQASVIDELGDEGEGIQFKVKLN